MPEVLSNEAKTASSLPRALLAQGAKLADRVALIRPTSAGAESLTYGELLCEGLATARRLDTFAGERVVLVADEPLEFVIGFVGIGLAGAVPVPLAPQLVAEDGEALGRVMADSGSSTILASSQPAVVRGRAARWARLDRHHGSHGDADTRLVPEAAPLAFLQYTSGSTGVPKGVKVGHGNLLANLRLIRSAFAFNEDSVMATWLPPHHDMGLIGGLLAPLYLGVPAVVLSTEEFAVDPARWLEAISAHRATISGGPNFAYDHCTRRVSEERLEGIDLASWRVAFNGAETVRAETLRRFTARFGSRGFSRRSWLPCYGLAEATLLVAGASDSLGISVDTSSLLDQDGVVPCAVLPGAPIAIVDPESGAELPEGQEGEIWVAGESVASGYWNRTSAEFGARLPGREESWLRTGDLGSCSRGQLLVLGRVKDLIVVRGRNHYPEDVEATVQGLVRARCVVFAYDDGVQERVVVACETHDSAAMRAQEERVRGVLASAHGLPVDDFVVLEPRSIPRTTSGKTRRSAARSLYRSGAWALQRQGVEAGGATGVSQELLMRCAAEALDLALDHLDLALSLPSQGLDSLRAAELVGLLKQRAGVVFPARALLRDVPLARLAAELRGEPDSKGLQAAGPAIEARRLTPGQQSIWLQEMLSGEPANCNLTRCLEFRGGIGARRISVALELAVQRHPALRLRFWSDGVELLQELVPEPSSFRVEQRSLGPDDLLDGAIAEFAARPFDLQAGGAVRACLFALSRDEQFLVLTAHHLVMDVQSLAILLRDLEHYLGTSPSPLPPARSFLDALPAGQEGPRVAALPPAVSVPLPLSLHGSSGRRTFQGATFTRRFDRNVLAGLRDRARSLGVTFPTLLFGCWARALADAADRPSFALGWVAAGREPDQQDVVGYHVTLERVKIRLQRQEDLAVSIRSAAEALLTAAPRDGAPGETPLDVEAVFAFQQASAADDVRIAPLLMNLKGDLGEWAGARVASVPAPHSASYFPLAMYAAHDARELLLSWEWDAGLLSQDQVERVADGFCDHLLSLLDTASYCDTGGPSAGDMVLAGVECCIHDVISRRAAEQPEQTALVDDRSSLTYGELERASNRIAHALISLGVGREDRVGVALPRSVESVVAVLGVLKSGAAYVPLDVTYPTERLRFMCADADLAAVLVDTATSSLFPEQRLVAVTGEEVAKAAETAVLGAATQLDDPAYVVYTSGSTGRPNGVVGLHRGIVARNRYLQELFPMDPDEVGSHKTSLSFFDSGGEIFWPLMVGARLAVVSDEVGRDPKALVQLLERQHVTRLVAVPSLLRAMLVAVPDLSVRLRGLRYLHSSGEVLPQDLADELVRVLPGVLLVNLYGSSEISADVTLAVLRAGSRVTLGTPLAGVVVRLLDEWRTPVGPGEVGEVCVGGECLSRGYLGNPVLTADRYVPDPGGHGARLFRTGDRGRWLPDGRLESLGRYDQQVKVRGHRIELGEVEAALRAHPSVADAAVALRHADVDEPQLVALVVPEQPVTRRRDLLQGWQSLYDNLYANLGDDRMVQDAQWTSSFTGQPFSPGEMAEWIDGAVTQVRGWHPQRVLEVGCGTGNLLLPLAPDCVSYTATDFSRPVIDHLRELLPGLGSGYGRVELLHQAADDLGALEGRQFDTVLLHSVVQYFPDEPYLRGVMERLTGLLAPGGRLLVGDVRDLALLSRFHLDVLRSSSQVAEPDAVAGAVAADDELCVAASLFHELEDAGLDVEVRLKQGWRDNELNRYRFDVVVRRPMEGELLGAAPLRLEWEDDGLDLAELRMRLYKARHEAVEVLGVPNARLGLGAPSGDAVLPQDLVALSTALGRRVTAVTDPYLRPEHLSIRVAAHSSPLEERVRWTKPLRGPERGAGTSTPGVRATNAHGDDLVTELRAHLRATLPAFMLPVLEVAEQLPRTLSGKVQRAAVAAAAYRSAQGSSPQAAGSDAEAALNEGAAEVPGGSSRPPRTHLAVEAIWRDVLGVSTLTPETNFFDAGGSSLSLVRVHLRLQELVGQEFPLITLYEHPTVGAMTFYVDQLLRAAAPVKAGPRPADLRREPSSSSSGSPTHRNLTQGLTKVEQT